MSQEFPETGKTITLVMTGAEANMLSATVKTTVDALREQPQPLCAEYQNLYDRLVAIQRRLPVFKDGSEEKEFTRWLQ